MRLLLPITMLICLFCSCKHDPYIYLGQKPYKDTVFTNYFKTQTGFVAGDGAYSTPLSNGKSLWAFGDSYVNDYDVATQSVPCIFDARSTVMLMDISNPA